MIETSLVVLSGGQSQKLAISTSSATSAAIPSNSVVIFADTQCFMRRGSGALSTGVDQIVPANTLLRVDIPVGSTIAFITATGSGYVYISPGA